MMRSNEKRFEKKTMNSIGIILKFGLFWEYMQRQLTRNLQQHWNLILYYIQQLQDARSVS